MPDSRRGFWPLTIFAAAVGSMAVLAAFNSGCGSSDAPPAAATSAASADRKQADGDYGHGSETVDPIATNGPIFVGWEKPKLALVITGEQLGYMEPCGCAGLGNQKGGLGRRYSMLQKLRDNGWPVLAIDLGGLVRRTGRQPELKYEKTAQALRRMGYAAVGLGADDLRLPAGTLVATTASPDGGESMFISANVGLFGLESGLTPRFRVVEEGGLKIGITSVLGAEHAAALNTDEIGYAPPAEALSQVVAQLEGENCDHLVLLSYASPEESAQFARSFPQFDIVITAGGADEPPLRLMRAEGSESLLLEVGHKGMYAITLGFYDDASEPIRYQRVPLDSRFVDAPEIRELMAEYQQQLQQLGWVGLELRRAMHPRSEQPGDVLGQYVGAQRCGQCHKTAHAIWSKSPHSHATETLARLQPQRQFDPECISCHSTGWNAQAYTPYEGGFDSIETTAHLQNNGCENCHGPGAAHAEAELGRDLARRDQMRAMMRLTRATAEVQVCGQCHDADNSPHFNFATYWPKVEHKGKK